LDRLEFPESLSPGDDDYKPDEDDNEAGEDDIYDHDASATPLNG